MHTRQKKQRLITPILYPIQNLNLKLKKVTTMLQDLIGYL